MRQLIKRCSNIGANVIGFIRVGSNTLSLIQKKEEVKGVLNGCEIFKTANLNKVKESVACVLSDLILNLNEKEKPESLIIYKDHWASDVYPTQEIADKIIGNLKKTIKLAVKVRAKEASVAFEPELRIRGKIDTKVLDKNAHVLNRKMANIIGVLQSAIKYANIIVNHKFKDKNSAWGLQTIQNHVDDVRGRLNVNASEINKTDFYREMTARMINKFSLKLCSEECLNNPEEKKMISQVIVPEILDNYEKVKDLTSKTIITIAPLVYIDELFKKSTNYPVNWFVDEDVTMNLDEDYRFLIDFLQEIPRIEANAIVPLDIFKDQIQK